MDFYTFVLELVKSSPVATLIGVIAGIAGSYFVNYQTYKRDKEDKAKSILAAIKAEIRSLVQLMEFAHYEAGMQQAIAEIERTKGHYFFEVPVEIDLFTKVYSANAGNLGLIDSKLLPDIVSFYAYIHGLVMDLEHFKLPPQGTLPKFTTDMMLHLYKEDLQRVRDTLKLGHKVLNEI